MDNALSWLNRFEATHLRRTTQAMLRHINDVDVNETKREQMIDAAIAHSRENPDRLEYPELLLNLAAQFFAREDPAAAEEYIRLARRELQAGSHAAAVAAWMQGLVAWKTGENWQAFSSWYDARQMFEELARRQEDADKNVNAAWYRDLLTRINMELVNKPEEAYTWLDLFDPTRLSAQALNEVNRINEQVNQEWLTESDRQDIGAQVDDLLNLGTNSTDPLESAEVLVESAMIHLRIGNITRGQTLLAQAEEIFPPNSHQRAVTLWLLGVFEWQLPGTRNSAITHWTESTLMMGSLASLYEQSGEGERAAWYKLKREVMEHVLNKKRKVLDWAAGKT